MAKRLWGCYSVADHLSERAFVADLLLYDRLLIPTPAPDDLERWKKKEWDPERQARMLKILGPLAERIEWSAPLRDEWKELSTQTLAQDADSAYQWTRAIISRQLEDDVRTSGDVRALAVYASPDGFDRDWRLVRSPLFLRRATTVDPGELTQVMRATAAEHEELAKLVVTQLVVPNDGRDDYEVLERTVELVGRPGVAERRAELHELIASLRADEGIRDQTVVAEVTEHLDALNKAVADKSNKTKAHQCVTGLTWAAGGFALWFPPLAAFVGPAASIGNTVVKRLFGEGEKRADGSGGVELLAEAQRALAG